MDKIQAQNAIKSLQSEAASLSPSALIQLFELDLSTLIEASGISFSSGETIFYFHNNIKLLTTSIFYQGNEYAAVPIQVEGYEVPSQGTLPQPKMTITVNDAGIAVLAILKNTIRRLGDFVGCKITRRRTFARFLDSGNFNSNNTPINLQTNEFVEFPPDIYYINRKSKENKISVEYELSSILDLEGVNLPKRQIIGQRCNSAYRGEGCLYEYESRRNDTVHGEFAILPDQAPPIATEEDKLITDILNIASITDLGQYVNGNIYSKGQSVYITQQGVKYYFVANKDNVGTRPPYPNDWIADKCSKRIKGCKLRFGSVNPIGSVVVGNSGLIKGQLPFGGFPATEKLRGG